MFNLTGAAVFCAGLPLYVRLTAALSPKGPELAVIARQIANAHTLFNVLCTLVWLQRHGIRFCLFLNGSVQGLLQLAQHLLRGLVCTGCIPLVIGQQGCWASWSRP